MAFALHRQSGQDVFRELLALMLRDVVRRGGSLSTVIFRIENLGPEPATESQVTVALAGIESLVRQNSGRMSDLLVKDVNAVYVALRSMVEREGERIADRVVAAFDESLAREKLKNKMRLSYTITGFPEEAGDEDAYLGKIFRPEAA